MNTVRQTGLTLIEVLVTLTIASILATVAVPSLQAMIQSNRLQSVTNDLMGGLYLARSEAAKRGFNVSLCVSNATQDNCLPPTVPPTATDFSQGWLVYTDYDGDGLVTANTTLFDTTGDGTPDSPETIVYVGENTSQYFSVVIDPASSVDKEAITYRANGSLASMAASGFTIRIRDLSTTELARITLAMTGRFSSCYAASGSGC